jgi:hypothetical protein
MAITSNRPHPPRTVRDVYDALPETPGLHAEIINGRLIVSPVGTPDHGFKVTRLMMALGSLMDDRGWKMWAGMVDVTIMDSRQPVVPDFVIAPADPPLWGTRELRSDGLIMVGEVVSEGSVQDDREDKPGMYASGGVPLMLLVDPVANPATVAVFSRPKEGAYTHSAAVRMGEPLRIPEPVDFVLDTAIFLDG